MKFKPECVASDREIALARVLYDQRRLREEVFSNVDLSEPGWDLLLYLFINQHHTLTTGDACRGSSAPRTTTLRHIEELTARGFVDRAKSKADSRKHYVALSDHGIAAMQAYLKVL